MLLKLTLKNIDWANGYLAHWLSTIHLEVFVGVYLESNIYTYSHWLFMQCSY